MNMNIGTAAFLGIVEGLTEFLPISSTFHLIWVSKMLGIPQTDFMKLFEVFIQSGAILAVIAIFFRQVQKNKHILKLVTFSFIPTAVVGLVLYKIIKGFFLENYILQLLVFLLVGFLFIIIEFFWKKKKLQKTADSISWKQAIFIGVIQSLAVIPGVSRAGAVILGMLFLGTKRDEAATYSFLLAFPTILAASALDLIKSREVFTMYPDTTVLLLIGSIAAFISALLSMKWFIRYLQNHSLTGFGVYRIVLSILLFLFFFR